MIPDVERKEHMNAPGGGDGKRSEQESAVFWDTAADQKAGRARRPLAHIRWVLPQLIVGGAIVTYFHGRI